MDRKKRDTRCSVCTDAEGSRLPCSSCPSVYHRKCLNPALPPDFQIDGSWNCPGCASPPIPGKIRRVLTWKWEEDESQDYIRRWLKNSPTQRKYMPPPRRLYFIHLQDKSFWNCEWVTYQQLLRHAPGTVKYELRNFEDPEPPTFHFHDKYKRIKKEGEGEEEDEEEGAGGYIDPDDTLRQRFYVNGVQPEWLRIHRVIDSMKVEEEDDEGNISFKTVHLVKWRGLNYEYVTWEDENSAGDPILLPEFQKEVEIYEEFQQYFRSINNNNNNKELKYKRIAVPQKTPTNLSEKFSSDEPLPFLDNVNTSGLTLHNYQIDGINWLRHSWSQKTMTILADEMGLGKTIQAITFLYSLYKEGHSKGPFLIAGPLSTIPNWERELEKWAPYLRMVVYTGEKESRQVIQKHELTFDPDDDDDEESLKKNQRLKFHVVVTSYEFITNEEGILDSFDWAAIVVDEAHRLKNGASKFFRRLADYRTDYKLLLTGTPLQNNLEELFYLLNFLEPLKFTDAQAFVDSFQDITMKKEEVNRLHDILGPHMLRRLKADVIRNMPKKSEILVPVELSPFQKEVYKHILTKNYKELYVNSKQMWDSGALDPIGKASSGGLGNIFVDLKKCCNHPYLFSKPASQAPRVEETTTAPVNSKKKLKETPKEFKCYELESLTAASGKLILLRKMLEKLKSAGHRTLIFSQMTRMLDILEDFLEGMGYGYERLDGSTQAALRQQKIDRFNHPGSNLWVFLLSTKAGGLGINLASADTVIIYDSDWNPHNDLQALSRAHRLGQTNKVMIYRFVTRNTVEERVAQAAKKKLMLNQLVVESAPVHPSSSDPKSKAKSKSKSKSSKSEQLTTENDELSEGKKQDATFTEKEMEAIVKFGAAELFEDKGEDVAIHYTDEAITQLLDRDQEPEATGDETGTGDTEDAAANRLNDYLGSFKVAHYTTGDQKQEKQEEKEPEVEKKEEDSVAHSNSNSKSTKVQTNGHDKASSRERKRKEKSSAEDHSKPKKKMKKHKEKKEKKKKKKKTKVHSSSSAAESESDSDLAREAAHLQIKVKTVED